MMTSLRSITLRSSRMKALLEESRVREESIGARVNVDGPASVWSCIASAARAGTLEGWSQLGPERSALLTGWRT